MNFSGTQAYHVSSYQVNYFDIKNIILKNTSFKNKTKFKGIESLSQTLNFLIPISLEPNVVDLWYFKLILFDLTEFIVLNILESKDIGFRKAEFVAKTQFL